MLRLLRSQIFWNATSLVSGALVIGRVVEEAVDVDVDVDIAIVDGEWWRWWKT